MNYEEVTPPPVANALPIGRAVSSTSEPLPSIIPITIRRLAPVETFSFWYLFDWKFERYLTPWIIRGYWVTALIGAVTITLILGGNLMMDLMPKPSPDTPRITYKIVLPVINEPSGNQQSWNARAFRNATLFISTLYVIVCILMTIRVLCELSIVLFNIALSAKSIEKSLDPSSQAGRKNF
jgi:hypothetical protein